MQINGIAHVQTFYGVGGRTAIALSPARSSEAFDQRRVGLHHLCFRLRSRAGVDALHAFLVERGARVVHPRRLPP
jgi:hypothetical protein